MKGRSKRASGGVNDMAEDAKMKNERRNNAPKIFDAAEARKRGGKTVGKVKGEKAKSDMGRMPRKSGGRTGSNMNPLSSAAAGTPAKGRNVSGSLD
jgi:hypothetical protein